MKTLSLVVLSLYSTMVWSEQIKSSDIQNEFVIEQTNNQLRYLPRSSRYATALDLTYSKDSEKYYYHGVATDLNAFLELRPKTNWHINLNYKYIDGTISDGYQVFNYNKLATSIYWKPYTNLEGRLLDLGRITFGSGLIVEDREAEGGYLKYTQGKHALEYIILGTALISTVSDLHYTHYAYSLKRFDLGLARYYFSNRGSPSPYFHSLYIRPNDNSRLILSSELGANQLDKVNYMTSLGFQNMKDNCIFCFKAYLQLRRYSKQAFVSRVVYDYIPYNYVERNFVNSMNILDNTSETTSKSVHFDLNWRVTDMINYSAVNEFVSVEKADTRSKEDAFWYRHKISYCPNSEFKNSCLGIFYSNKNLGASSPFGLATNRTLIYGDKKGTTVGLEANVHL